MTDDAPEARPAVSVILPLHNGRRYLRETVASIAGQTMSPTELIVVDDGSTDGGADQLLELELPFPVHVKHQVNAGQSAARNHGARLAVGELLAFIDQDDLWHPRHLAGLARPFSVAEVGWSYSDFDEIDSQGRTVTIAFLREHAIEHPKRTLKACLESDLMVLPSASVIRRQALETVGGFDAALRGYEDDDLYVRMFRTGWRMAFVDEPLTRFRVHPTSSSTDDTFVASRLAYARKLRATVEDDLRLGRRWFRDVVSPRFLHTSLDDYMRAISSGDWEAASSAYDAVELFARGLDDPRWERRLALFRRPQLTARLLRANQRLPRGVRVTDNPLYRMR